MPSFFRDPSQPALQRFILGNQTRRRRMGYHAGPGLAKYALAYGLTDKFSNMSLTETRCSGEFREGGLAADRKDVGETETRNGLLGYEFIGLFRSIRLQQILAYQLLLFTHLVANYMVPWTEHQLAELQTVGYDSLARS